MKYTKEKQKNIIKFKGESIEVEFPLSSETKQTAISIALESSKVLLDPMANGVNRSVYSKLVFESVLFGLLTTTYAPGILEQMEDFNPEETGIQEFYDFLKDSGITDAVMSSIPKDEYKEIVAFADDAFERANNIVTSGAIVLENFLMEAMKALAGAAILKSKEEADNN